VNNKINQNIWTHIPGIRKLGRNTLAFLACEFFWGVAIPLVHPVTVSPAFLKGAGAPLWTINLIPQAIVFLGAPAQIITLRYFTWTSRRRVLLASIQCLAGLTLLPLAWLTWRFDPLSSGLIWGSLALILLRSLLVSIATPLYYGLMMEVTPVDKRGRLMGLRLLTIGSMGLVGASITQLILNRFEFQGYQYCFIIAGIFWAVGASCALLVREIPRERGGKHVQVKVGKQIKQLLSLPHYRRWSVSHLCLTAALGGLGMVTVFYQGQLPGEQGMIGTFTLIIMILYVTSGPLFGKLGDRGGYKLPSMVMLFSYALVFCFTTLIGNAWLAYPVFILIGLSQSAGEVWMINFPSELLSKENQVQFIAVGQMLASPVALLAALIYGSIADSGASYRAVLTAPSILALAALIIVATKIPEPRRDNPKVI
jgi:MFS family permease